MNKFRWFFRMHLKKIIFCKMVRPFWSFDYFNRMIFYSVCILYTRWSNEFILWKLKLRKKLIHIHPIRYLLARKQYQILIIIIKFYAQSYLLQSNIQKTSRKRIPRPPFFVLLINLYIWTSVYICAYTPSILNLIAA